LSAAVFATSLRATPNQCPRAWPTSVGRALVGADIDTRSSGDGLSNEVDDPSRVHRLECAGTCRRTARLDPKVTPGTDKHWVRYLRRATLGKIQPRVPVRRPVHVVPLVRRRTARRQSAIGPHNIVLEGQHRWAALAAHHPVIT